MTLFSRHKKLEEQSKEVKKKKFRIAVATPARAQQLVRKMRGEERGREVQF
jgi:hypothetical protein